MLDHYKIKMALRNQLLATSGLSFDDPQLAFANVEFSPPVPDPKNALSGYWLKEHYIEGDEVVTAWNTVEGNGLYQVDIHAPWGSGDKRVRELRKMVMDQFDPRNVASVSFDGVDVVIVRATPLPYTVEQSKWYILSTQVSWRCHDIQ